jgi:ferric iron reductase protein FhuF
VSLLPGDQPVAAISAAPGRDPVAEIQSSVAEVVSAVAAAGRMRESPLWAIATDSLANQLLALGRARGDVPGATALAGALATAIGPPLPMPRYVDVAGARFTRRASCCLMYLLPGQGLCTSCPRRPPAERRSLLEQAARFF